jgi:hypothetical protein
VAGARAGGRTRPPPYIGDRFDTGDRIDQPGHRDFRNDKERTSVVLGRIKLVGGAYRNRGWGEGGLLELPVEVVSPNLSLTESWFEMQRAFPGLRGLGKLAQIGDPK